MVKVPEKATPFFEYAPAPESRSIVDIKASYGLFIDGEFVDGHGKSFKTISPSTEEVLAEIAEADESDVDLAVKAARRAHTRVWGRMPGSERAKYLYRIARIIQERGRELAVLESIDNGKPIKESRDVDIPVVAAHFFYYAGWADKLVVRRTRPRPQVAGRRRPDHPVELPAADAGVEDRAGARRRQHGRAQAGRDHAPDRAAVRGDLPAGRPAARRRQHRHRRGRDRPGDRRPPRRRQDRLHRLHRRRQGDRHAPSPAPKKKVTLELGGKAANIVFDDAPDRPGRRGHRQRHLLQPGPRLLRRVAPARAGVGGRRGAREAQAPDVHAARGRPARQEHRHRRHQLRRAARQDPRALRHRRGRGRRALVPRLRPARATASGSRRRSSPASPRPTGSPARRSSARCSRC